MRVRLFGVVVIVAVCAASGEPIADSALSYAAPIAAAHAHYRLGEYGEARRWLVATPEERRGWEFGYLAGILDTSAAAVASGHESVNSIDLSSDGRFVLTAATDGAVEVRRADDFGVVRRIGDHTQAVYRARFSPDGSKVATVSRNQRAVVWDAATGGELSSFGLPNPALADVAFSPDGSLVALCAWQMTTQDPPVRGMVRVWNAATGEVVREAEVGVKPLSAIEFTPDGGRVVMASWDGIVHVLEVAGDGRAADIAMPNDGLYNAVTSIAVSPDGRLAAAGSRDATVRIIDLERLEVVETLRGPALDVLGVAFSRDGAHLAATGADSAVRVWRCEGWIPAATLVGHSGSVRAVAFAAESDVILSAGYDGVIRSWGLGAAAEGMRVFRHDAPGLYNAVFSPDGTRVTASCFDGRVRVWDAVSGATVSMWTAHEGSSCHTLASTADGARLVTGSWEKSVRLWDANSGGLIRAFEHGEGVYDCTISPDGSLVAAGLTDGTVHLWSAAVESEPVVLTAHAGQAMKVAFSDDGAVLATGGADGRVRLWSMPEGREIATLEGHRANVSGLAFSRDGSLLASCAGDGRCILWDVRSGAMIRVLLEGDGALTRCGFSPDGSRLVVTGDVLRVVDVERGGSLLTLKPHGDAPYDACFSPDGTRIASCSTDGTLVITSAR